MTVQQILLKYWGHSHFRPLQEEVIESVLNGKDTLALLPTGGGKSVCFQVPALSKEGICIVISPLIALMKDQVERLKSKGIKALAITSGMTKKEIDVAFDNCVYGNYKFLYLSPERLGSDLARARLQKMKINLLAVDEAHCISQWGYDFRPSYLKIAEVREFMPGVPVLALTASATPEVAQDIQKQLLFKKDNLLRKSFERKNLAYVVIHEENKLMRLLKIVNRISGCGIVYARNRKKTQEVSDFLKAHSISADFYHAGLEGSVRDAKQEAWLNNRSRVIVCTNAFGMGIDKPDVRFVVHLDLPDCPEAYFQEAGRAGRDEKKSYAILLFSEADKLAAQENFRLSFPALDEIRKTYQSLANYFQVPIDSGAGSVYDLDLNDLCGKYGLQLLPAYNSMKFLEREGLISLTEAFHQPSRLHFIMNKEELYKFQVEHPRFDEFVKVLLRSYTGLFDTYVKISELDIAKRSTKPYEEVKKLLAELQKLGVVSWFPQTDKPRLTFTAPRLDAKQIVISEAVLQKRKEKALVRMESMLHYAESRTKCRSQLLLSYFGETDSYRCGVCDFCVERNKLALSNLEFENVKEQVKLLLHSAPMPLSALVNAVRNSREDKTLKVIQWLIDNEKIQHGADNMLFWKK